MNSVSTRVLALSSISATVIVRPSRSGSGLRKMSTRKSVTASACLRGFGSRASRPRRSRFALGGLFGQLLLLLRQLGLLLRQTLLFLGDLQLFFRVLLGLRGAVRLSGGHTGTQDQSQADRRGRDDGGPDGGA